MLNSLIVISDFEDGAITEFNIIDDQVNYGVVGTYPITVTFMDSDKNYVEAPATVEVILDEQPMINVTHDYLTTNVSEALTNEDILALTGATVSDNKDLDLVISVDQSAVDYSVAGVYTAYLSTIDSDGYETIVPVTIEVQDLTPSIKI